MKEKVIILFIFSLFVGIEESYSKSKEEYVDCYINKYWWDRKAGIGSGNMVIGKHRIIIEKNVEERTNVWNFMDEETQVEVKAEVKYYHSTFGNKKSPINIEASLSVADPKTDNQVVTTSFAKTRYNKHFEELTVYKKIFIKNLEYTYLTSCQRVK